MKLKQNRPSFTEALRIHIRAAKELSSVCPGRFSCLIARNIVEAICYYLPVFFSARILNELAGLRRANVLILWAIIAVASTFVYNIVTNYLIRRDELLEEISHEAVERLYIDKLLSMDFADTDRHEIHDLLSQIRQNDRSGGFGFSSVAKILSDFVFSATGILTAIGLTVSLITAKVPAEGGSLRALNSPLVVALAIIALLAVSWVGGLLNKKGAGNRVREKELSVTSNRIRECFGKLGREARGAADIRIYGQEKLALNYIRENDAFSVGGAVDKLISANVGVLFSLSTAIRGIFTGGAYLLTCLKALGGAFGIGSVTQYVGAITLFNLNVFELTGSLGTIATNAEHLKTAYEFLDMPNKMYQGSIPTEKRSDREYDVEFRDVSFKYPGAEVWALRHLNVKFRVGARFAVVGENGSGKTTFIKLLCRLYDPQEGQILLNGIDIRKYNYREYMDLFSVVFQDFALISQPIGANVAGTDRYEDAKVTRALEDAGFGQRLRELGQGLDACLYKDFGDEGINISGGESQKIAIARALYKNAPFLILDEPTAALDPMAEADIYARLGDIVSDRTAIFISHRLSSCRFCDEILVFDEGKIVQRGSHDRLLSDRGGKYEALWHAQAQYYTAE